ncbi:hypothetical protein [uncultured Sunxiuqinia sp.]|uniref:hypothetical protein n=1 Tax=uncultured Sunxiuqinia sp. TaxID=1573825 RepID=UPI002AA8B6BA|nr:hypothetical protein [uncultured Sunxiuqinia sp.]
MNIDRTNYEIYFLDYLDGTLLDNQVDVFLDFLNDNPDLHEELKAVSAIKKLEPDLTVLPRKEVLKKNTLTESPEFDYRAIALMENDLSIEDEKAFIHEITSNPKKELYFDQFLRTKLQVEPDIVFNDKERLYKKSNTKILMLWASHVAAVLLLSFFVYAIWNYSTTNQQPVQLAEEQQPDFEKQKVTTPNQAPIVLNEYENQQPKKEHEVIKPIPVIQPTITTPVEKQSNQLITIREAAPATLKPKSIQLKHNNPQTIALVEKKHQHSNAPDYLSIDEYLAEKVLNKDKNESLSLGNIITAGLDAVSTVSNERVDYEKNGKGKLSEISLNTRLFAFSIPLKKD